MMISGSGAHFAVCWQVTSPGTTLLNIKFSPQWKLRPLQTKPSSPLAEAVAAPVYEPPSLLEVKPKVDSYALGMKQGGSEQGCGLNWSLSPASSIQELWSGGSTGLALDSL